MKATLFILTYCQRTFVKKVILLLVILLHGFVSFAQDLEESFSTISAIESKIHPNVGNVDIVKYENNLITFAHKLDTGLNREKALSLHLFLNSQEKYESAIREAKDYVFPLYGVGQKYFIDATSSYVVNNYYTSILGKNHGGGDSLIRNTGYEYPLTSLNDVYRYATNKFQKYDGANCKLHITTSGLVSNYGFWKPTYSYALSQSQFDYFEDIAIQFNVTSNKKNNLIPNLIESIIIFDEPQTPLIYRQGLWETYLRLYETSEPKKANITVPKHFVPEDTVSTMIIRVFKDETSSLNLNNSKIPNLEKSQQDFNGSKIYRYTTAEKDIIKKNLNTDKDTKEISPRSTPFLILSYLLEYGVPINIFNTNNMLSRNKDIYKSSGGIENFDTLVDFLYIDNYIYIDSQAIYNKHSCIVYNLRTGERYNLSIPSKKRSKSYQLDYTGVSDGSELPESWNIKFGTPNSYYKFGRFPKQRLEYNCTSNGCEYSGNTTLRKTPLFIYAILRNN